MNQELEEKIRHAIALSLTPFGAQLIEAEMTFEKGCIELATIVGSPLAQIEAAASRVACGSAHENHLVPAHLLHLIRNTWLVENTPEKDRWIAKLANPTECTQGCRTKFYQYLEGQANEHTTA